LAGRAAVRFAIGDKDLAFTDWQALRDVSDFNQRYLHIEVQQAAAR